jgi:hypothetical protein
MFPRRLLPAIGLALGLGLSPARALAFEGQWHAGGGIGAGFFADSATRAGPAIGLHGAYGLSDYFDVKLEGLAALHSRDEHGLGLYAVSAGLAYKIDVIQWIPYVGVQVGYYRLSGTDRPGQLHPNELGMSVDLGMDYAVSRSFGLGLELRYHGFLSDPLASLGDAPYFSALLRAEYRWGW